MRLFRKRPPKACPKCGKADGWRVYIADYTAEAAYERNTQVLEQLRPGGYKAIDYTDSAVHDRMRRAIRYHCDHCGYDKTY